MAVSVETSGLSKYGWEIGIFCVLFCFITIMILQKIQGDFSRLTGFFALKEWEFIEKSKNVNFYAKLFKFMVYFMVSWPIISLLVWGFCVLGAAGDDAQDKLPGISILLVGLAIMCWTLGILYVKFNNFKFTKFSLIQILLGTGFFFAFQIVALFIQDVVSFFGISSVFLTINVFFMILIVQMMQASNGLTILEIINNKQYVQEGDSLSKNDMEDLNLLIKSEEEDQNYKPTQQEILQLFTLVNYNKQGQKIENIKEKMKLITQTALGGGFMDFYRQRSPKSKFFLILFTYLISVGILILYACLGYSYTIKSEKYLCWITAIAVVTTDLVLFFLMKTKMTQGPFHITIMLIGIRALLFGFGGDYWFIGYCALYIFFGVYIGLMQIDDIYPLYEKTISKEKKPFKTKLKNFIFSPHFVQILIFFVFLIINIILEAGDYSSVPTNGFKIYDTTYDFYLFGIASLLINIVILCYLTSMKIYLRKSKGIQDEKKECKFLFFTPYYAYLFASYAVLIFIGVLWYSKTDEYLILFSSIFLPLIYESFMIIYYNWQLNDYRLIADIKAYNEKMIKYKEQREKQRKKRRAMQKIAADKNPNGDKSVNEMLQQLENVEDVEDEKKKVAQQSEIVLHVGGGGTDIMSMKHNFATYKDWKDEGLSFFQALKLGKLLKTDYITILSIILLILFMSLYSALVGSTSKNLPYLGITISASILTIICVYLPLKQYFATLKKPNCQQIVIGIFGFVINFCWGGAYYFIKKEEIGDDTDLIYYCSYFLTLVPWAIFFVTFIKKWIDNKYKVQKIEIIFCSCSLLFAVGMALLYLIGLSVAAGCGIFALWFFVYYSIFIFYIYKKNNDSLPRKYLIISGVLILAVCSSVLIVSLILDSFNDFFGFSIFYLVSVTLLFIFAYTQLQQDFNNQSKEPIFASPWIFPMYKYNSAQGNIQQRTRPFSLFTLACLLFLFWAIALSIWVSPVYYGTSFCNISLCFMYVLIITLSSQSQLKLGQAKEKLNEEIVKSSWLTAKKHFLTVKHATCNQSAETYEKIKKEKKQALNQIVDIEKQEKKDNYYFLDYKDAFKEFHTIEEREKLAFQDEVGLLINFQVLVLLKCDTHQKREMKAFNDFIQQWSADLADIGIIFQQDAFARSIQEVYHNYKKQYDRLPEEKRKQIENLREKFADKKKEAEKEDQKRAEEEEKKAKEREEELKKRMAQKQAEILAQQQAAASNPDLPAEKMIDSPAKYLKILQEFRKNKELYEDKEFKREAASLTAQSQNVCGGWSRPKENYALFKQGYSPMDVQQGYCGDCYFLSALSVIGEKHLRNVFMLDDPLFKDYQDEIDKCGAYICRFFYAGEPQYVIVDTFIPQNQNKNGYLFACSDDELEIWPQIVEKAYAKLYGSYGNIEGGKVAYAVMELVGGQPEEIELKQFQDNCDQFWNDLLNYQKMGYILGAGSPAHEMGDAATSSEGIVYGHAYSVLSVMDLDGNKLICLRNPHGNASAEWTGDWGDSSYLWNDRLRTLCGQSFGEDGMFWMCIDDFVYEYRALYVCRMFPENIWKTLPSIKGKWTGKRAAGLPTPDNPKALMQNNPHYGITVSKNCNLYVSLTILEKNPEEPKYGLYPIYFMCQKNDQSRIKGRSANLMVGQSGMPTPLTTTANELKLNASSYPYTFSLMVATTKQNGEASYVLQVYCTDKGVTVIDDAQFGE